MQHESKRRKFRGKTIIARLYGGSRVDEMIVIEIYNNPVNENAAGRRTN